MTRILTHKQYANRDHRRMVAEYGVALSEARSLYPLRSYQAAWWRYVLESFEAGMDFTPAAASRLSAPQLRDLSRSTRGLRSGLPMFYLMAGQRLALRNAA